ncbi:MAG: hypothetical protein L3K08_01305 [Thermoplasmata archaeon]|nr:hypothetical protein [Thermoplasmata archaeon]
MQLPAEIDSPSTAAYQVAYIERTVGFQPAFYELGNEPAHWKHFGIPWSQWNSSQHTGATPAQYASVVHAYISAIRAVDPTARILGLPGVGTGGYNEASWISATVAENGPNLSGVAIHVYPAGPGSGTTPSLASFYASLSGGGTIAARVPADRIAVQKACPNCTNPIPVIVTELGSGNGGRGFDAFMKSYRDVPYIATELLQAMTLNVTNVDLFALEGTYPGSILGPNSALTPIGTFYSAFADRLGFGVLPTVEARDIPGFHLVVTTGRSTGEYNLLAVNTNVTTSQSLSLSGSGFPLGPGVVVGWNATSPAPRTISYATGIPTNFTIPPGGIVLIGALPVLGRVTPGLTSVGLPSQENQPLAPQVASPGTAIPGGVDLPPSAARSSIARWAE